jgi:hypothetical protein
MKNLLQLDHYRVYSDKVMEHYGSFGDAYTGVFAVPYQRQIGDPDVVLRCVASSGGGWDHVSVSTPHRTPTWAEMEFIKRQFFMKHEVVMQLHVSESDHISIHDYCLHLWRPHDKEIPLPPKEFV